MIFELHHFLLSADFQDASSVDFNALSALSVDSNIHSCMLSKAHSSFCSSHVDF